MTDVINSNCTTNEVRLTGGSDQHEGRVEYCVNGVWQSICDYEWDDVDAHSLCRQLGYQGIAVICFIVFEIENFICCRR